MWEAWPELSQQALCHHLRPRSFAFKISSQQGEQQMKQRLKQFFLKLYHSAIPMTVPRGLTAMNAFIDKILSLYNLPNDLSYRHAVASMIMHMDKEAYKIRLNHIASALYAAMSKQVAYQVLQDIKQAQDIKAQEEAANVQKAD